MIKLNLGCGLDYQDGYINVDLYPHPNAKVDAQYDVTNLPYLDNTVDEIRAFHIIEHFDFYQGQAVLKEWHRVLKPQGRLWLETPDFLNSCRAFVEHPEWRTYLYGHFFSTPWLPGLTHKILFTEDQLKCQLEWTGFINTKRLDPCSSYVQPFNRDLFLNLETFKP